jgi:hypothetical protein
MSAIAARWISTLNVCRVVVSRLKAQDGFFGRLAKDDRARAIGSLFSASLVGGVAKTPKRCF